MDTELISIKNALDAYFIKYPERTYEIYRTIFEAFRIKVTIPDLAEFQYQLNRFDFGYEILDIVDETVPMADVSMLILIAPGEETNASLTFDKDKSPLEQA